AVSALPLSRVNNRLDFVVADRPPATATDVPAAQNRFVTPGYFAAIGVAVLRGREFTKWDTARSPGVVLIDEELERRFFSDRPALRLRGCRAASGCERDLCGRCLFGLAADPRDRRPHGARRQRARRRAPRRRGLSATGGARACRRTGGCGDRGARVVESLVWRRRLRRFVVRGCDRGAGRLGIRRQLVAGASRDARRSGDRSAQLTIRIGQRARGL